MDEKDRLIQELWRELGKWKGRAREAAEIVCNLCRENDPDRCRTCRTEKIRREAGNGLAVQTVRSQDT